MAIALRAVGTPLATGTRTSSVIPMPAGLSAGDEVRIAIDAGIVGATAPTITPPGSATLVATTTWGDGTYTVRNSVYRYRYVGSGDPASFTFTHASAVSDGVAIAYSGVDATTPDDATAVTTAIVNTNATGGNAVLNGITTVTANAMLVVVRGSWDGVAITPPGGWTERLDQEITWLGEQLDAAPGATGTISVPSGNIVGGTKPASGIVMALRPSSGVQQAAGSVAVVAAAMGAVTKRSSAAGSTPVATAVTGAVTATLRASGSVAVTAAISGTAIIPEEVAPIIEYGFNEGSGSTAADSSGSGLDATATGSPWTPDGHTAAGALLDSATTGRFTADALPADVMNATVMMWLYLDGNADLDGNVLNGVVPGFDPSRVTVFFEENFLCSIDTAIDAAELPVAEWLHVAWTYDADTTPGLVLINFYVDGVLRGSGSFTPGAEPTIAAGTSFEIGYLPATDWNTIDGRLDDFRIFPSVLTPTEIATWMATPVAPAEPQQVAGVVPITTAASGTIRKRTSVAGVAPIVTTVAGVVTKRTRPAGTVAIVTNASGAPTKRTPVGGTVPVVVAASGNPTVISGPVQYPVSGIVPIASESGGAVSATLTATPFRVLRTNLALNPRGTDLAFWDTNTPNGTLSLGAGWGPYGTYVRNTRNVAGALRFGTRMVADNWLAGEVYTVRMTVRASEAMAMTATLRPNFTSTTNQVNGGAQSLPAGESVLEVTFVIPTNLTTSIPGFAFAGSGGGIGSTLDVTQVQIEKVAVIAGPSFDGSTPGDANNHYSWAGGVDASISILESNVVTVPIISGTSGDPILTPHEQAVSGTVQIISQTSGAPTRNTVVRPVAGVVPIITTVSGTALPSSDLSGTVAIHSGVAGEVTKRSLVLGIVPILSTVEGSVISMKSVAGRVNIVTAVAGDAIRFTGASGVVTIITTVSGEVTVMRYRPANTDLTLIPRAAMYSLTVRAERLTLKGTH